MFLKAQKHELKGHFFKIKTKRVFLIRQEVKQLKYKCTICGHIYDESVEGTKFEDLPDTWVCPICGVGKEMFEKVEE